MSVLVRQIHGTNSTRNVASTTGHGNLQRRQPWSNSDVRSARCEWRLSASAPAPASVLSNPLDGSEFPFAGEEKLGCLPKSYGFRQKQMPRSGVKPFAEHKHRK